MARYLYRVVVKRLKIQYLPILSETKDKWVVWKATSGRMYVNGQGRIKARFGFRTTITKNPQRTFKDRKDFLELNQAIDFLRICMQKEIESLKGRLAHLSVMSDACADKELDLLRHNGYLPEEPVKEE